VVELLAETLEMALGQAQSGVDLVVDLPAPVRPVVDVPHRGSGCAHEHEQPGRQQRRCSRPTPYPLGGQLQTPGGPRHDRLTAPEPAQVISQRGCRRVAPLRILLQTLQADGLEVARHSGVELRWRHRVVGQHLLDRRSCGLGPKWRPPS
jgi:hypothetical protein